MEPHVMVIGAKSALCLFDLGNSRYGVPLSDVQEFVRMPALTPLPNAPVVIAGVTNLHGRVIPVVDLRSRFNIAIKQAELSDYLLIVRTANSVVGLWVDGATGTCDVPAEWITSADTLLDNTGYITGVAKLPDGLVLIHDLATLLAESECMSLDIAMSAAEQGLS